MTEQSKQLPVLELEDSANIHDAMGSIYTPGAWNVPGVIVPGESTRPFAGRSRLQILGGKIVSSMRSAGVHNAHVSGNQYIRPTVASEHHLDGPDHGTFMQMHVSNDQDIAGTGIEIAVRMLDTDAQRALSEHVQRIPEADEYVTRAALDEMDAIIREGSKITSLFHGNLRPGKGDAVVFRNGHRASSIKEDRPVYLTTHAFWSVDENGNRIEDTRRPTVENIQFSKPVQARAKQGRLSRIFRRA